MTVWHPDFYQTEKAAEDMDRIRICLEKAEVLCRAYIITLSSNPAEQLDIYSLRMFLKSREYKSGEPCIVGVAATREEAVSLIETMAKDIYEKTGDCDFRKFFSA